MKEFMKRWLPDGVLKYKRTMQLRWIRAKYARMTTREAFSYIYKNNIWGKDAASPYCSGTGSRGKAAQQYIEVVRKYIRANRISSVLDIGCGDYFIGSQLADSLQNYHGVDIVPELIQYLTIHRSRPGVEFSCRDVICDDLPPSELCLVRQVLQHLSNDEILALLPKLEQYKHVLITEHYPSPRHTIIPNLDKPHGPDTRIIDNSAVYLDLPPYNLHVEQLLEVPVESSIVSDGETIRTFLIRNGR